MAERVELHRKLFAELTETREEDALDQLEREHEKYVQDIADLAKEFASDAAFGAGSSQNWRSIAEARAAVKALKDFKRDLVTLFGKWQAL